MKRPWMKFYPSDWRADPRLRMCSLAARGLWIDLMSYMHEGEPYGHLTIDGSVPDLASVAALVARPVAEVRKALAELEDKRVCSRATNGAVYSRRMVKDRAKLLKDSENGKGGGNPKLKEGVNPPDKAQKPESRVQSEAAATARAGGELSALAFTLASDLAVIAGHPFAPPDWPSGWMGAPMRVQTWLNSGLGAAVIVAGAKSCAAKKRSSRPIQRVDYFEGAIYDEHERQSRPTPPPTNQPHLPLSPVVVSSREQNHVEKTIVATDWKSSRDAWRIARAKLAAGVEAAEHAADTCGQDGQPPVRNAAPIGRG